MSDVTCAKCSAPLRADARFCSGCGAAVTATVRAAGASKSTEGGAAPMAFPAVPAVVTPMAFPGAGSLIGPGGLQGGVARPTKREATRADLVTVVAKWSGAIRRLRIDGQPAPFADVVGQILSFTASFRDIGEPFENIMFLNLANFAQSAPLLPAINAALQKFPRRFSAILADMSLMRTLVTDGPIKEIFDQWPYTTYQASFDVPDAQLEAICAQAIYEGAILLNLVDNGFLDDERARLESGMYPPGIQPLLMRAHSKCETAAKKSGGTNEGKAEAIVKMIAPFAHPEVMQGVQAKFGAMGMPCPFQLEPLSDWELNILYAYAADQRYDRGQVVNVLVNLWERVTQQIQRLSGQMMGDAFVSIFAVNQFLAAAAVNINSRRLNPANHRDYGHLVGRVGYVTIPMIKENLSKEMPELFQAVFPQVASLFQPEYQLKLQLAQQAAAAVSAPSPAVPAAGQGYSLDVVKDQLQRAADLVAEALATPDPDDDILSEMELQATVEKFREALGLTPQQLGELSSADNLLGWLRNQGWVQ